MKKLIYVISIIILFVMIVTEISYLIPNNSGMIIDKYERNNNCYLVIEVTPEEYIGYEIGDNYEM